jgi:hypothetical protein
MNDEIEARLREALRTARLPAAPDALRGFIADLPSGAPRITPRIGLRARPLALGLVAIVVAAVGLGALVLTSPAPTATPVVTPTAGPSAGFRRFDAPGISFDYPADWVDQSDRGVYPTTPGTRYVAVFGRGLTLCPDAFAFTGDAKPQPGICEVHPTTPGSMVLRVIEWPNQYPVLFGYESPGSIAGNPVWGGDMPTLDDRPTVGWGVKAPDNGLYYIALEAPRGELEARRAEVLTMLATLHLSPWSLPEHAVNGRVHLDFPEGFSFDYPAGWSLYYPRIFSMGASPVVTVSSKPFVAADCTPGSSCPRLELPPGSVEIGYAVASSLGSGSWSDAPTTLAGQPAFHDWGPAIGHTEDEEGGWTVRLGNYFDVLHIRAYIRGPDAPALRAVLDEVIASVRIRRVPAPNP